MIGGAAGNMNLNTKFQGTQNILEFRHLLDALLQSPKDMDNLKKLKALIANSSSAIVQTVNSQIFCAICLILKQIAQDRNSFSASEQILVCDILKNLFDKVQVENLTIFFNIYGFLLFQAYDAEKHQLLNIDEDYKMSIVQCMSSLVRSLESSVIDQLYTRENAPKLVQIMYVLVEWLKNEQYRTLRINCIKCIMAFAQVLDDDHFSDLVTKSQVREVFMFYLPGIAQCLKSVALSDEKVGHQLPCFALKAWGRIVTLLMQDYNAFDQKIDLHKKPLNEDKCKSKEEVLDYVKNKQRTAEWYKENDKRLQFLIKDFQKLTHHSHRKVRLELMDMSELLIENCTQTMPQSIGILVEIVIALSEDDDREVSEKAKKNIGNLALKLSSDDFKTLLENLEESFYKTVASLPRTFNGIDAQEQLVCLNLLSGYIRIFGKFSFSRVLHSMEHLKKLIFSLIHISEFNRNDTALSEIPYADIEEIPNSASPSPWKKFRYFKEESIYLKIEAICALLPSSGVLTITSDFLFDIFNNDQEQEHRKEATFLLNGLLMGVDPKRDFAFIKNVMQIFTEKENWYLPLNLIDSSDLDYKLSLGDVRNNITQASLLTEGIGKIALISGEEFDKRFMLKILYMVFERAGAEQVLVSAAGKTALSHIVKSCKYKSIGDLINRNMDYLTFHIERKFKRAQTIAEHNGILNVLDVMLKYSTIEVLQPTSNIMEELIILSTDKRKDVEVNGYLKIFKMFLQCLHRWFQIQIETIPRKSKKLKLEELEQFKVSGIDETIIDDFSDDIMGGKTAEELYKEDLEHRKDQLEDDYDATSEAYKKPEPPSHVGLTVKILGRSLHFLPSKNKTRKLLVLEILKLGLEVIREWEDELLPLVHLIWSPLVDRFKEFDDPVVISFSFQLLVVLARLSKEFIRSRTVKEVLPSILEVLDKFSKNSYLKDRGNSYRYSQAYKLQLTILELLGGIIVDLDMMEEHVKNAMEVALKYLSNRQPVPLQIAAIEFFKTLIAYDPEPFRAKIESWKDTCPDEYQKNLSELINQP